MKGEVGGPGTSTYGPSTFVDHCKVPVGQVTTTLLVGIGSMLRKVAEQLVSVVISNARSSGLGAVAATAYVGVQLKIPSGTAGGHGGRVQRECTLMSLVTRGVVFQPK